MSRASAATEIASLADIVRLRTFRREFCRRVEYRSGHGPRMSTLALGCGPQLLEDRHANTVPRSAPAVIAVSGSVPSRGT